MSQRQQTVKGKKEFLTEKGHIYIEKVYFDYEINPVVFQIKDIYPSINVTWNGETNTVANKKYSACRK